MRPPSPSLVPTCPTRKPPRPRRIFSRTLQLHGYRPFEDEPDPRPLPEPRNARGLLYDSFDAVIAMLADTRLEADLPDVLWSMVNLFHRRLDRIERDLNDNEQAQRRLQCEQDGSEVKSVELERLIRQGRTLIERRNGFEFFRDHAAELYESRTGSAWRPRSGSMVNHRALTAAMIDSRDFINAKRRADAQVLIPTGTRVAFTGGSECNDVDRIWAALDKVIAKYADMVLLHGGSPKGAELIAAKWASNRNVPQVVFKPDWAKHKNAAPFKRNDQNARGDAGRRRRVPRQRRQRQPGRQGEEARHPGNAVRSGRRVSAVLHTRNVGRIAIRHSFAVSSDRRGRSQADACCGFAGRLRTLKAAIDAAGACIRSPAAPSPGPLSGRSKVASRHVRVSGNA